MLALASKPPRRELVPHKKMSFIDYLVLENLRVGDDPNEI